MTRNRKGHSYEIQRLADELGDNREGTSYDFGVAVRVQVYKLTTMRFTPLGFGVIFDQV